MSTKDSYPIDYAEILNQVCVVLEHSLGLPSLTLDRNPAAILLGNIPELDSMAIVSVLTSLENHFGFIIYDDELNADVLATLGNLVDFILEKIND